MQARLVCEGDVTVMYLLGRIDVETVEPFRAICATQLKDKPLVFDFKNLSFVGSNGILPFLEALQDFKQINFKGIKFSSVGIEFKRLFTATLLRDIAIYENAELAILSFTDTAIPSLTADLVPGPVLAFDAVFAPDMKIEETVSSLPLTGSDLEAEIGV